MTEDRFSTVGGEVFVPVAAETLAAIERAHAAIATFTDRGGEAEEPARREVLNRWLADDATAAVDADSDGAGEALERGES